METLDCNEIDYETIDIENETNVAGATKIRLNLPKITDEEFPTVSIVIPTYNRPDFFELIMRNWERIDYPSEKLELIICDDTPKAKKPQITDKRIRYYTLPKKVNIGEKRNLLCNAAKHEYIVHMDDDDWYPPESVACRIRILLEYQKKIKKDACFGCTKVLCLDLITNQMFEAFDTSKEGLPATLSESTMAYSKRYWEKQHFKNDSKFAECLPLIENRLDTVCTGPSVFIVTQFTHGKNTVQRRIEKNHVSEYNSIRFEKSLSVYDSRVFNNIRAKVIQKLPTYPEAINFMVKFRENNDLEKFKKEYKHLDNDVKANPLVINLYQDKMVSKEESSGKDIVYYCGPGEHLKFSNKWNPESKQLGGSEEAVINLSKELAEHGYNVTVYCVLEGKPKLYGNVMYKPYYEWIPKDVQDITIIWRDPSNTKQIIHTKQMFLDLHDAIDPKWLFDIDPRIKIMTKSNYHTQILTSTLTPITNKIYSIPNGIYNGMYDSEKVDNLMICTSSPDRCLRALLRALPLIRQEVPDAQIHWAYGFKAGITEGGMEKDPRTKSWVEESKELIENTPGFIDLGRLSQSEINELYKKADVFIYPTRFPEIDCISLSKALSFGCIPIVTPSGAIAEKIGVSTQMAKLESKGIDYSLEEGPEFDKFVKSAIAILKKPRMSRKSISSLANDRYSWKSVAEKWINEF
jgi:glycosyltransferase involved in cell wall biosynthesis